MEMLGVKNHEDSVVRVAAERVRCGCLTGSSQIGQGSREKLKIAAERAAKKVDETYGPI